MNVVIPSGNMTRQKAHHSRHARPSSSRRHHSNGHTRPSYAMSVEEHFNVVEVGAQQQQNPVADVFEGASFSGRLNDRHAVAGHPMADLTSTQYELAPMNQDVVVHRDFHHHPTSEGHDPPRHHLQEQCNENATPRAVLSSGGWSTQSLGYPDPSPVRWYYPKPDAEVSPAYGPGTLADDPPAPIRSESDYLYSTGTANTGRPESFAPGAVQYSYELSRQRHDTNTVPYLPTLGEGVSSSRSSLEVTNGSAVYVYHSVQYVVHWLT